jgi:hypothetical protein
MEKSSKKVLLDTNFLTIPQQFHLDVEKQIKKLVPNARLVTLESVTKELEALPNGQVGMEMIEKGIVEIEEGTRKDTDEEIIEYAVKKNAVVCTNDKELKNRLTRLKVPIIYLRKKTRLELKGVIK